MSNRKESLCFSNLVAIAKTLEEKYEPRFFPQQWADSPFGWLKTGLPSRTRGKAAEVLVEHWLSTEGFEVSAAKGPDADLIVNGIRTEVKMSTLWDVGTYKFQQIRDQDYEMLICIGLSPSEAHCWVLPKEVAMTHARHQHGGAAGRSNVRWFTVDPGTPPRWLRPQYGRLRDALAVIQQLTVQGTK